MIENLNKITIKLYPDFITGFADAEPCFHVSVTYRVKSKLDWQVRATFQIGLHIQELPLLLSIQDYFGGIGNITIDKKDCFDIIFNANSLPLSYQLFLFKKNPEEILININC